MQSFSKLMEISNKVRKWLITNNKPYYYFCDYEPAGKTPDDELSESQRKVLYFKHGDLFYKDLIHMELISFIKSNYKDRDNFVLVCVPSSKIANNMIRYEVFSERVCEELWIENGYNHIEIIKEKWEKHKWNYTDDFVNNIRIDWEFFKDKYVILFDDVITKWNTINEMWNMLAWDDIWAKPIIAVSIWKTVRHSDTDPLINDDSNPFKWKNKIKINLKNRNKPKNVEWSKNNKVEDKWGNDFSFEDLETALRMDDIMSKVSEAEKNVKGKNIHVLFNSKTWKIVYKLYGVEFYEEQVKNVNGMIFPKTNIEEIWWVEYYKFGWDLYNFSDIIEWWNCYIPRPWAIKIDASYVPSIWKYYMNDEIVIGEEWRPLLKKDAVEFDWKYYLEKDDYRIEKWDDWKYYFKDMENFEYRFEEGYNYHKPSLYRVTLRQKPLKYERIFKLLIWLYFVVLIYLIIRFISNL